VPGVCVRWLSKSAYCQLPTDVRAQDSRLGVWDLGSGTRDSGLWARDQEHRFRGAGFGTRGQGLGVEPLDWGLSRRCQVPGVGIRWLRKTADCLLPPVYRLPSVRTLLKRRVGRAALRKRYPSHRELVREVLGNLSRPKTLRMPDSRHQLAVMRAVERR